MIYSSTERATLTDTGPTIPPEPRSESDKSMTRLAALVETCSLANTWTAAERRYAAIYTLTTSASLRMRKVWVPAKAKKVLNKLLPMFEFEIPYGFKA